MTRSHPTDAAPAAAGPAVSLTDQIACVQAELAHRRIGYPMLVRCGMMRPAEADRELMQMAAVLATLRRMRGDA